MSWSNVRIFEDTRTQYQSNDALKQSITRSAGGQQIIREEEQIPKAEMRFGEKANVTVSSKRTFEAAQAYAAEKKVCVLNFASSTNPGGGVVRGASAQEECLCRCSTLYACLNRSETWENFYNPHRAKRNPLYDDDCIYTPDVVVFKSDTSEPQMLAQEEWYRVNVITCAAPNLRNVPSNMMNPYAGNETASVNAEELYALHCKRLRRILDVAALNKNDVVILGAFGCGAFANDPEIVSRAMNDVVQEHRHMFGRIEFAVYCSPRDMRNYEVFRKNIAEG